MKKLSVVVLVLLLVSMITYGEDLWRRVGAGSEIAPILYIDYVGIGTDEPNYPLDVVGTTRLTGSLRQYNAHVYLALGGNNKKVGIGETSPDSKLHVTWSAAGPTMYEEQRAAIFGYNTSTDVMYANSIGVFGKVKTSNGRAIYGNCTNLNGYGGYFVGKGYFSGNVGIGVTNPSGKLDVNGNVFIRGNGEIATFGDGSGSAGVYINGDAGTVRDLGFCTDNADHPRWVLRTGSEPESGSDAGSDFTIVSRKDDGTFKSSCLTIKRSTGNVGIGTTTLDYKLNVNGTIRAKEIKVEADWSDFVFADNYKLMPLDKLEQQIKVNRSLPGIPTEKEVLENGVSLGEMQAKLLEKVEELTLYVIELKKENEELKTRISALEK